MADYLTVLPKALLQEIIIKATAKLAWRDPYVLYDLENTVQTLLSVRGTCKILRESSDFRDVYRACHVDELPDLVASSPEVARFVDSLFISRNLDVLFLRGIRTMFMEGTYSKGLKLVEEAMEAENPKGTYMFCILKLLNGLHLESDDVERVFRFLGPLKENGDMV
ncbi:hypothetical protein CJ030_MR1G022973 [Morella rubra]|uniref:Uncharacterized protein n=1 Tax=Morella rubra TaxID=262757 RepID=A0A6A1WTB4_9ROSI|nr:hypothetical protein CJ030_MR1G022973 [Morella rubra]